MKVEVQLDEEGRPKMQRVYSKRRRQWVLRRQYTRTTFQQVQPLMQDLLRGVASNKLKPVPCPISLPNNISRLEKPDMNDMVHITRFIQQ